MKAVIISKSGEPSVLKVEDRALPSPAGREVLVRTKASGVNRPDIMQRKGFYPAPEGAPADIPGLEASGIIEACGPLVTRWKKGDAVCALTAGGAYAEYFTVDERHCLPLPKNWSYIEAASLPETVFTVWHNVFQRGRLQKNERFLVHGGSSGIGITAIQLAAAAGARVYATAGNREKCAKCEELGAEKCIDYKKEDFESALKYQGIDVILDMVGGVYFEKNLRLLNPDGRLIYINTMEGSRVKADLALVMQRRLTITGSTLRPRSADFKAELRAEIEENIWPLLENGKFKPVIHRVFPYRDAAEAHQLMESSQHIGKIILSFE